MGRTERDKRKGIELLGGCEGCRVVSARCSHFYGEIGTKKKWARDLYVQCVGLKECD